MSRARPDVVAFGTYDSAKNPRMSVLVEGLRAHGLDVAVASAPVGFGSKKRIAMLRRPWLLVVFVLRLLGSWTKLWTSARALRDARVVIVGWMGYLDVHLAKLRFRRATIVLDHLTSLVETADDRDAGSPLVRRALAAVERRALASSDVVCVDTKEHLDEVEASARSKAIEVPVGASAEWFRAPVHHPGETLRVIFFGQYTPLQGGPVLGRALRALGSSDIEVTMIGDGQEYDVTRQAAADAPHVRWITWLEIDELRREVRDHDVCLGIFGSTPKALRVVPNKVFQGAASGLAIVTSDTPPQRRALDDDAIYVPPGDDVAIVAALRALASDRVRLWSMRQVAFARAERFFRPDQVTRSLVDRLATTAS